MNRVPRAAIIAVAAGLALTTGAARAAVVAHGKKHQFSAGEPGDPTKPSRLVPVTMKEGQDGQMLYSPDKLAIRAGDQIRFRITNAGSTAHEFMLDTAEHNAVHKAAMQRHPGMMHDEANGVMLEPGMSAEIVWRFGKAGSFEYACLIPGHYESGMHGDVAVR